MSRAGATLILVVAMFAMAFYLLLLPPSGFEGNWVHRIAIPFLLIACALNLFDNLKTRVHLGQLVGALRVVVGQQKREPTPQVKGEAIQILLKSMRTGTEEVRATAAAQLSNLTGERFGTDIEAWEVWWRANRSRFSGPASSS